MKSFWFSLGCFFAPILTFAAESFKPVSEQEKAMTTGLATVAISLAFTSEGREEGPLWTSRLPGDQLTTDWLGTQNYSDTAYVKNWSHWTLAATVATPMLFPRDSGDTGRWQATQSYAITGIATRLTKSTFARERPYVAQCRQNRLGQDCFSGDQNASFLSGHTAFAFTGAGLTCALRSDVFCPVSLGLAAATGVMRIATHQHYLSDVVVSAVVGWTSGYLLTKWRTPEHNRRAEQTALGYQMAFSIP